MVGPDLLFASWAQTPIGAAIDHADDGAPLPPATFEPGITLIGPDDPTTTALTGPSLALLGPGAVTGLDPRVVRRLEPPDGASAVEPNYLAAIELVPVELPWLFTPASPGAHDRLRPWLVLVVVAVATSTVVDGPGLPLLQVGVEELPDLADSWAWVHVQVPPDPPPPLPPGVPPVVGTAVARLVCPRLLSPDTAYRACLVPAFAGGVVSGGGTVAPGTPETAPAWDVTAAAGTQVGLPVLTGWQFATGPFGDFEMLVRRLEPADPALLDRLGLASVDVSDPWHDGAGAPTTEPRTTVDVPGALQSFEVVPGGTVTAQQLQDFEARLCAQLDAPALRVAAATDPAPDPGADTTGAVAPPIYGGRHALRDQIAAPAAGTPGAPGDWVDQLNLGYATRIAAGLGAHYVQANAEQLMAHAWDQVGAIREANRCRHLGELGAAAGESLHRRHILPLSAGEAVGVATTTAGRTPVTDGGATLRTEVLASPLPDGAATGAFARLLRPSGPVARRAGTRAADLVTRGLGGGVTVPRPGTLLSRLPVTTVAAAPSPLGVVSAEAVTRGLTDTAARGAVMLQAVADVARTNGFATQAAAIDAGVAGLGIAPTDLRAGDLTAVRSAVATNLPAVDSMFEGALKNTLAAPAATGFAAPAAAAGPTAYGVPVQAAGLATRLATALRPTDGVGRRVAAAMTVPPAWTTPTPLDTVLAYPTFDLPAALALLGDAPEWFLPGIGDLPAERVVLLEPNASFVEAYLVGLAQRLNSELRWREYPTDLRGTPFNRFWPRSDVGADIAPITTWTGALGSHLDAAGGSVVVLLVRGSVVGRFPDMVVSAVPGLPVAAGAQPAPNPDPGSWLAPLFVLPVDPQTAAYAFAISPAAVSAVPDAADPGWFFGFQEHTFRLRFGFEPADPEAPPPDPVSPPVTWDDLTWDHLAAAGAVQRGFAVAGTPVAPPPGLGSTDPLWDNDAADIARISLRHPFRVLVQAHRLVAG